MESKNPTRVDRYVSKRLSDRRIELGVTQESLADRLGISSQQFQKYENGKNRISAGRLFQLAIALDTTIPYFFEGLQSVSRALHRGVSEEGADFEGPDDVEATELVMTFRSIPDAAARRAVMALARKAAEGAEAPGPKARRKRT
ncbi:MAG TPA: helix-turn-helix transcriptional regulator [Hyphomonadaceae bacterium]|nr:helix-turn-helix transcriptional regulator [Hyphomonadaceae bacterium]